MARRYRPRPSMRIVPSDRKIRSDHARIQSVTRQAASYGVKVETLQPHLKRLGLRLRQAQPVQAEPVAAAVPRLVVEAYAPPLQDVQRLSVVDLVAAARIARDTGCEPELAVQIVRADRDVAFSHGRA